MSGNSRGKKRFGMANYSKMLLDKLSNALLGCIRPTHLVGVNDKYLKPHCKGPIFNPFSVTGRSKRHQNKVRVKGLGRNSSYLAGFSIYFHGSVKKFNQLAKKNCLKFFSSIKTNSIYIYIPWSFPPVWGVADNTKETTK